MAFLAHANNGTTPLENLGDSVSLNDQIHYKMQLALTSQFSEERSGALRGVQALWNNLLRS